MSSPAQPTNPKSAPHAGAPLCAAFDSRTRKPQFTLPAGATDCHAHICGPAARYDYFDGRIYTPPDALPADYRQMLDTLGVERAVLVQPSVYGTDNSCTLDAIRQLGARARGVAVIDQSTSAATLDDMAKAGVRGVRLNFETAGESDPAAIKRGIAAVAEQVRSRNWHVQFNTSLAVIAALRDDFAALPFPVVFDHFARAKAALGPSQPGFDALLALVKSGRAYVKISAAYRTSDKAPDFPDTLPLAQALIAANPERIVWGSNWPHPGRGASRTAIAPPYPSDDGRLINQLPKWAPDAATRRKILVENPARLYGFGET